ncbi:MAG: hypothetical protein KAJ39_07400 [Gammaproteobacteria bacterium]|nr:hypothetical protein [Gammaproteobacteria bacterium]
MTRKSLLNIPAMELAGVTTLSNFAYCITCKEVGLIWILESIVLAKDLAKTTLFFKAMGLL